MDNSANVVLSILQPCLTAGKGGNEQNGKGDEGRIFHDEAVHSRGGQKKGILSCFYPIDFVQRCFYESCEGE